MKSIILIATISFIFNSSFGQAGNKILYLVQDTTKDEYAYLNLQGDTIIPFGKYLMCYTQKFDKFAIVSTRDKGLIGIDRNENALFNIFIYDNGPDYISNGLFRIIKNDKIGYADKNGKIVIPPKFDCAYPFIKSKAKVGTGCKLKVAEEHSLWTGGKWHYIDKRGNPIPD